MGSDALPAARRLRLLPPVVLDLELRSVYVMQGPIRWQWQHRLLPTKMLRFSITFRTRADEASSLG